MRNAAYLSLPRTRYYGLIESALVNKPHTATNGSVRVNGVINTRILAATYLKNLQF